MLHLGHKIGLADYRDIQSAFISHHKDPEEHLVPIADNIADLQQGHSSNTALEHYGRVSGKPRGVHPDVVKGFNRTSRWWQHLTGELTSGSDGKLINADRTQGLNRYQHLRSQVKMMVASGIATVRVWPRRQR